MKPYERPGLSNHRRYTVCSTVCSCWHYRKQQKINWLFVRGIHRSIENFPSWRTSNAESFSDHYDARFKFNFADLKSTAPEKCVHTWDWGQDERWSMGDFALFRNQCTWQRSNSSCFAIWYHDSYDDDCWSMLLMILLTLLSVHGTITGTLYQHVHVVLFCSTQQRCLCDIALYATCIFDVLWPHSIFWMLVISIWIYS